MCGLAGEVRWRGRVAPGALLPMIASLAHRGPDAMTSWISQDGRVALGHALLSFFTKGKAQPLAGASGKVLVVCNGEIYNHRELAARLRDEGVALDPSSDVEVLPYLYERYASDMFTMLRGEFAIAVYDARDHSLVLARDRFGVKPLYFALRRDGVLFGSEMKAVLAHPEMERAFDRAAVARQVCFIAPPGETLFAGVRAVKPGSFIQLRNGVGTEQRYWTGAPKAVLSAPQEELAARLEALLTEAVRLRLHGDHPVGAYLSGGMDSSSVLASLVKCGAGRVKAFTIQFDDPGVDESALAAVTAKALGVEHHIVPAPRSAIAEHFLASLRHNEIPVLNWHGAAKFLLSRTVAQHVKAVQTGEGSDELFAGYSYFARSGAARQAQRYPFLVSRFGCTPNLAVRAVERAQLMRPLLSGAFAATVSARAAVEELVADLPDVDFPSLAPVDADRVFSMRHNLPAYTLNMCDRTEMSHGVEGRPAFLDDAVVEFALGLPVEAISGDAGGKRLLRMAFAKRLPAQVLQTPKRPLVAPDTTTEAIVASHAGKAMLSREITEAVGVFDFEKLDAALRAMTLLPADSPRRAPLRTAFDFALSLHGLYHLFVRRGAVA